MTTTPKSTGVIENSRGTAPANVEAVFAELLADVLRVDHVSADSHFFDDLGADSLVMAHFCARVRKRGDLPPVSMKDIYRYPTIRGLAEAGADLPPPPAQPAAAGAPGPPTPTNAPRDLPCGAAD